MAFGAEMSNFTSHPFQNNPPRVTSGLCTQLTEMPLADCKEYFFP